MIKRNPRLYFSFQSPYSWLGTYVFENKIRKDKIDIEYIPYWDPGNNINELLKQKKAKIIKTFANYTKHLYIIQDVKRLTEKMNLKMKWPLDADNQWDLPHISYLKARDLGKGNQFMWEIYYARWEKGENVCDKDVILKIADKIDIDGKEIIDSINDVNKIEEGVDSLYRSYRDDVFGVPFFINGYNKFWGIERIDDFLLTFKESMIREKIQNKKNSVSIEYRSKSRFNISDIPEKVLENIGCYDIDHPGGCG